MDSEAIFELTRRVSRDGFILRFSMPFLAVKVGGAHAPIGFTTQVVETGKISSLEEKGLSWEILPVAKAAGNPYPDRISIGRARNCDVVMRDPTVSKLHAHFRVG